MKKSMGMAAFVVLSVALLVMLLPLNVAFATGFSISPGVIEITGALHGEDHLRTIRAQYLTMSGGVGDTTLELSCEGAISEWVTFHHPDDPTTPIQSVTHAEGENAVFKIKIAIPEDAPVGVSTGTLWAKPITSEGEGMTVMTQGKTEISVEVLGEPIMTGKASAFAAQDIEVGYPLRVKFIFTNTGNVVATPETRVEIIKNGKVIDSYTYSGIDIPRGKQDFVVAKWANTDDREPGDYTARVTVFWGGEMIASEELEFTILPEGSLSILGEFTILKLAFEPELGTLARIDAGFSNTGQKDAKAQFIGEAYLDGKLIGTVVSAEIIVPVDEAEILSSYVELEHAGSYTVTGYVNYEGKATDVREVSFEVIQTDAGETVAEVTPAAAEVTQTPEPVNSEASPGEEGDSNETSTWYLWTAIAVVAVVVLVVGNTFVIRKKMSQSKV